MLAAWSFEVAAIFQRPLTANVFNGMTEYLFPLMDFFLYSWHLYQLSAPPTVGPTLEANISNVTKSVIKNKKTRRQKLKDKN